MIMVYNPRGARDQSEKFYNQRKKQSIWILEE